MMLTLRLLFDAHSKTIKNHYAFFSQAIVFTEKNWLHASLSVLYIDPFNVI